MASEQAKEREREGERERGRKRGPENDCTQSKIICKDKT